MGEGMSIFANEEPAPYLRRQTEWEAQKSNGLAFYACGDSSLEYVRMCEQSIGKDRKYQYGDFCAWSSCEEDLTEEELLSTAQEAADKKGRDIEKWEEAKAKGLPYPKADYEAYSKDPKIRLQENIEVHEMLRAEQLDEIEVALFGDSYNDLEDLKRDYEVHRAVWLPRFDQLLRMLPQMTLVEFITDLQRFLASKNLDPAPETIEQATLCYFMNKQFNKAWTGKEWK